MLIMSSKQVHLSLGFQKEVDAMLLRVGIENGMEGRSLAWALEHPGCFAYGKNEHEALQNLPSQFQNYVDWITRNEQYPWLTPIDPELHVEEIWEAFFLTDDYELADDGYEVDAWFLHDWKPLTGLEIERGIKMLSWSRKDLLDLVAGLSDDTLNYIHPGERWSIVGILKHVGGAEWWYQDLLDLAFPRDQVPEEWSARLEVVRDSLIRLLPTLVGVSRVVGKHGEFWSPRKLLRRALWHEIDHIQHIQQLIQFPLAPR